MAEPASSFGDLASVLQQLRLQRPGASSPVEATQAQIELLLTRIASLTEALRGEAPNGSSPEMARLLLADLSMVAAQFRGNTTAVGDRLTRVLDDVRAALERTSESPTAREPQ